MMSGGGNPLEKVWKSTTLGGAPVWENMAIALALLGAGTMAAPLLGLGAGAGAGAAAGGEALGAGLGADLGMLAEGLGAGAAGELGATSSSIGAAGEAANPLSILFSNAKTAAGPYASQLGKGLKAYQGANALMGAGQPPPHAPPAPALPPMGGPPTLSSEIFARKGLLGGQGQSAGMGGIPPEVLMMLLQKMQQGGM
jgi:hypothetical protein